MSYSLSIRASVEDFAEVADQTFQNYFAGFPKDEFGDDQRESARAALDAVSGFVKDGLFGDKIVTCNLFGHGRHHAQSASATMTIQLQETV